MPSTNATGARVSINSRAGGLVLISALLTKRDLASKDFDYNDEECFARRKKTEKNRVQSKKGGGRVEVSVKLK